MDHVPPFSPARRYTFQQKYLQNPSRTRRFQSWSFVVVAFLLCLSSKDSHDFPLKRNVFSWFFINLSLFPKDYHTFWKLSLHLGAPCFHQFHEIIVISQGLPHNLQAYFLLRRISCCQLNKHVIITQGLPHILKHESSLGRLLLSAMSWKCSYFLRITTQFASLLSYCVTHW